MAPLDFEALRPKLEAIAYRMTGSAADAEDLGQEAWLRWSAADRSDVEDPEAYLVRIVTRLALDRLGSAARRRETYVGPYLPEPLVRPMHAVAEPDPEEHALLADSLTYSFLVLLDELGPLERAVLLLHDVFGYPFDQVASAVDRSVENVRQIASRSRRRIAEARPGWDPDAEPVDGDGAVATVGPPVIPTGTLFSLMTAMAMGDVSALLDVLAPDVVTLSDGGPVQRAARRPVTGADKVARLLLWLYRKGQELELSSEVVDVNGRIGLELRWPNGEPYVVMTGDADDEGRVGAIYLQLNPEKLRHLRG